MIEGRNGKRAKYKHVYDHFVRLIDTGALEPGDRLPTGPQLEEEYEISHATATKVYRLLRDHEYVRTTPQGTYVLFDKRTRLLKRLADTLNALEEAGQDMQLEVGRSGSCIMGRDGGVCWDHETEKWEQVTE